ncbi:feruloyl esterase B [Coniochaeta ligniaria NRRL 30616]|uniref:Carboxylic ester hydrolase n=1 Tax=Coniochaeta ligniaria NRRL 30616 TaxID=1408157 RepID=A0A1J7JX07_9PEZI|nr:feruloyl esterase B [Coniochaeta ligniaria NRRL 30616]
MLLSSLFTMLALVASGLGAKLEQVANFGGNPTKINMYIYVPDKLASKPAVIVALHPCGGTGPQWYSGTKLPSYADQTGFILIYPSTPNQSNCWDVQNAASLTHRAGGDALGIVNMVNYTLAKYNGDAARVFAMGSSSGAMMTNVLAGSYPDVFEAGSAYSGIAFACSAGAAAATPFAPNQTCAQGLRHTAREWGDFVRNAYPGYAGRRPRMQIWHGLADTLVRPQCAVEALKQWSDVLDVAWSKNVTGTPSSAYTQMLYGDGTKLQGYFGVGVGHTAPVNEVYTLRFFGLVS